MGSCGGCDTQSEMQGNEVVMWEVRRVLSRRPLHNGAVWERHVLCQWAEPENGFVGGDFADELVNDLAGHVSLTGRCSWRPLTALDPQWALAHYYELPAWPQHLTPEEE
mmetsp:Transcript_21389/g.53894  ORF Transcript_21389/g.53894 Transcript_21389/m.53894 type:complete len:109 (-) Transcript_21389:270-596(-)|eukprot:CAMPEP_0174934794 /NCGR_PEP_ID=MMETSP1355-20121228/50934_1 /TAXON_ID=464990 /ORGANISM="Hemiselmis tepida, Strain CCMP443" /LENGTH=108 /DNA_ID=CAMNT_0016181429 /DNA_START=40 /DNA_END=366 /DNA_ORIENTATION=+